MFRKIEHEIRNEGIKEGETKTFLQLIKTKMNQGKDPEQIQEELCLTREEYLYLIEKL